MEVLICLITKQNPLWLQNAYEFRDYIATFKMKIANLGGGDYSAPDTSLSFQPLWTTFRVRSRRLFPPSGGWGRWSGKGDKG